ncbi:MAG: hypothetical protein E3J87_00360 [Candidatus Cloacimonadota bacterium]|nr:MAG: hypothetical protein E3J87_00360 [Candidatus Cloacimonadota bacterium]
MLKIKKIRQYRIAKYPQGIYYHKPDTLSAKLLKTSLTATIITLLESSCVGVCGPPPVEPGMVTENEARSIIKTVFNNNNVNLEEDISYFLKHGENDSTELILDGFNDSLSVGYEYSYGSDNYTFTYGVINTLDSLINESGPYIKCIDEIEKEEGWDYKTYLEDIIQEFIDYLKTQGVI